MSDIAAELAQGLEDLGKAIADGQVDPRTGPTVDFEGPPAPSEPGEVGVDPTDNLSSLVQSLGAAAVGAATSNFTSPGPVDSGSPGPASAGLPPDPLDGFGVGGPPPALPPGTDLPVIGIPPPSVLNSGSRSYADWLGDGFIDLSGESLYAYCRTPRNQKRLRAYWRTSITSPEDARIDGAILSLFFSSFGAQEGPEILAALLGFGGGDVAVPAGEPSPFGGRG